MEISAILYPLSVFAFAHVKVHPVFVYDNAAFIRYDFIQYVGYLFRCHSIYSDVCCHTAHMVAIFCTTNFCVSLWCSVSAVDDDWFFDFCS